MHVMFTDVDDDVHVWPRENIALDSDADNESLEVTTWSGGDYWTFQVEKEEFERLTQVLTS